MPDSYKSIIEKTSTDYKKPMRDGLDEIARYNPKILEELSLELKRTNIVALQLKCRQEQLLTEIGTFQEEAKNNLRNVRKFGANGLLQIQHRGGVAAARSYLMSEELPTEFYREAADKIEHRLRACASDIEHLSAQLTATMTAVAECDRSSGFESGNNSYGQQSRVGPQQLVRLIQHQGEAFVRVAACVAEVHKEADEMRAMYRRLYCPQATDPFAAADKIEEAKERILLRKLRDDELRHASNVAPTDASQPPPTGQPGAAALTLGGPAAATGGFGTGGGFAAPGAASSSWSLPAATGAGAGAGAGAGGMFGAPATGGFGSAFGASAPAPAAAGAGAGAPAFGSPQPGPFSGGFGALGTITPGASTGFGLASPLASAGSVVNRLDLATPAGGIFGAGGAFGGGLGGQLGSVSERGKSKNGKNKK